MTVREVHGWRVSYSVHPVNASEEEAKPQVRLEKGDEWVVTRGRRGIDPEILLERATIEALKKDLAVAPDVMTRREVERALHRAITTERISQEMRRETAALRALESR